MAQLALYADADAAGMNADRPGAARRQLASLHDAIHAADDALLAAQMLDVAQVQGVLVLMDDAWRLALSPLPALAALIQQAQRALAGTTETARMSPEERRLVVRSLFASILREIHVEVPHRAYDRPN